jgi:hypothetical protein
MEQYDKQNAGLYFLGVLGVLDGTPTPKTRVKTYTLKNTLFNAESSYYKLYRSIMHSIPTLVNMTMD